MTIVDVVVVVVVVFRFVFVLVCRLELVNVSNAVSTAYTVIAPDLAYLLMPMSTRREASVRLPYADEEHTIHVRVVLRSTYVSRVFMV